MSDLDAADLEAEAQRLVDELGRPKRRVRPRLARLLNEAEDQEVSTPHGGIMAWRLGTGRATLMVHGWEDDNALWSPLIDLNAEMMRGSVAFDLPGHGWSPAEECSIQAAGAAVLAVAEAFGPIDSVVAHSFGCPSTIWAMANGLNVERAVMIASPVPRTETRSQARDMTRWEQAQLHEGVAPEVIARARELMAERPMVRSSDRDAADPHRKGADPPLHGRRAVPGGQLPAHGRALAGLGTGPARQPRPPPDRARAGRGGESVRIRRRDVNRTEEKPWRSATGARRGI
jgi:pimeloyl-ACP methyl ester carboxylesterase